MQRQQLWSCSSQPNAPSLHHYMWAEAVSWCLCKHLHEHFPGEKKISASTAEDIQGGGRSRDEKTKRLEIASKEFTRHNNWHHGVPQQYSRFLSSKTKASVSSIRKHSDSGIVPATMFHLSVSSLTLPESHYIFLVSLTLIWSLTADYNAKSGTFTW